MTTILALIKSNEEQRSIVRSTVTQVVAAGAAGFYFTFTFPELRKVEQLLHIELDTDPEVWIQAGSIPQDKSYVDNVVGLSLHMNPAAGTTLTLTAIALGF